jgi:hypothetical protein
MPIKHITRRILAFAGLLIIVFFTGIVTVVFYPQPLFAEKIEYNNFCIFSSQKVETRNIAGWVDQARALIAASELYDSTMVFQIFLAHDNIFNDIESIQGVGPIARATAGNIIIKIPIDPTKQTVRTWRSEVNIAELLAHEMVHVLQTRRYGMTRFNPFDHPPMWKLEGYPEYISRRKMLLDDGYDLEAEILRYVELERSSMDGFVEVVSNHFVPSYYYKGRLMVEYLMDMKGLRYDDILEDERTEEQIWSEILETLDDKPSTRNP